MGYREVPLKVLEICVDPLFEGKLAERNTDGVVFRKTLIVRWTSLGLEELVSAAAGISDEQDSRRRVHRSGSVQGTHSGFI